MPFEMAGQAGGAIANGQGGGRSTACLVSSRYAAAQGAGHAAAMAQQAGAAIGQGAGQAYAAALATCGTSRSSHRAGCGAGVRCSTAAAAQAGAAIGQGEGSRCSAARCGTGRCGHRAGQGRRAAAQPAGTGERMGRCRTSGAAAQPAISQAGAAIGQELVKRTQQRSRCIRGWTAIAQVPGRQRCCATRSIRAGAAIAQGAGQAYTASPTL